MKVYAIRDLVANALVGGLHLFAHDAPAVRFFGDIASDPQTMIARHPADYDLICIGQYNEDTYSLTPERVEIVITGAAYHAAHSAAAAARSEDKTP